MKNLFKKLSIILIISLLTLCSLVSCKKDIEFTNDLESAKGEVVTGLSAYELASAAYNNWKNNVFKNHQRIEELDFAVNDGVMATRKTHQIYKVDGDKLYSETVEINSGLAGSNNAHKILFDGQTLTYNEVGRKKVPGKEPDIFVVSDWGTAVTYSLENDSKTVEEYKVKDKKLITTYNLDSKDYLDSTHDDRVYKYTEDGTKYVCTITIDMSLEAQKNQQIIAKKEFENALGVKEDSLVLEPVTITFLIEKVNDTYRVLQWSSFEKYTGELMGRQRVVQTYKAQFSYDEKDYKIG